MEIREETQGTNDVFITNIWCDVSDLIVIGKWITENVPDLTVVAEIASEQDDRDKMYSIFSVEKHTLEQRQVVRDFVSGYADVRSALKYRKSYGTYATGCKFGESSKVRRYDVS